MRFLISAGTFALIAAWAFPRQPVVEPRRPDAAETVGTPAAEGDYTRLTVDYAYSARMPLLE